MKVDYDKARSARVQEGILQRINDITKESRRQILTHATVPQRKRFFAKLKASRAQAFQEAGIPIPKGLDLHNREARLDYIHSLSVEQRVSLHRVMAKIAREAAEAETGLEWEHAAAIERVREQQLDDVLTSRSEEDLTTLSQITRDTCSNVITQHNGKLSEKANLRYKRKP